MPEQVLVKAIFVPETKMFQFDVGPAHVTMSPEQFGRMVEYLELCWESYTAYRQKNISNN